MHSRYEDSIVKALAAAIVLGGFIGLSSLAGSEDETTAVPEPTLNLPPLPGMISNRAREPVKGDQWQGCAEAMAAGTAPIFRGEPGYDKALDKDNDGIACEPYSRP